MERHRPPVEIVAEIGINHNGNYEMGVELIDAAVEAGADWVKFQLRSADLYREAHTEDVGTQYTRQLIDRSRLHAGEMCDLFDHVRRRGAKPFCTPWDLNSLRLLETYGMDRYKIASADLTNHPLIQAVIETGKPMVISTGMSSEVEIVETVRLLRRLEFEDFILLHCHSAYPAPFRSINLAYISRLSKLCRCPVGYSGHERGWAVAIGAVALGACMVEKHITLDRDYEGNDHKVSLLPHEFADMVNAIRETEQAIGTDSPRFVGPGERMNRMTLSKSIVAARPIAYGQTVKADDLRIQSPGAGIQPNLLPVVIGKAAVRDYAPGDFVSAGQRQPREYTFARRWGIPVRYHDVHMAFLTNPTLIEFHLSYLDLESVPDLDRNEFEALDLVVHAPDIYGDYVLDLAGDENRAIEELSRVVTVTRYLSRFFRSSTPRIVVSMGGLDFDRFWTRSERLAGYKRVARCLEQVETRGVQILAQTLPPFPWYFGGQRFLNLFVHPDEMAEFCSETGVSLCLDVSHAQLACNHYKWRMREYITAIHPWIEHLHLADAGGIDAEGLQIQEGDIDWPALAATLREVAPDASFIPEIWFGHQNGGDKCWEALERLENVL